MVLRRGTAGVPGVPAGARPASPMGSETEAYGESNGIGKAALREVQSHQAARCDHGDLQRPQAQAEAGLRRTLRVNGVRIE